MEPTNIVHFKFEISQKPQNYHKAQTNDKDHLFYPEFCRDVEGPLEIS